MKVFVTGTRGVPGIPGGVERHCEQLYPLMVLRGVEILMSRRAPYVIEPTTEWQGIKLIDLYAPCKKSLESIFHTALSMFYAKKWGADIVHIHAIGPAIMTPLGRILGMKVVVTNHGPDYNRLKWGRFAKTILRMGEYLGCNYANEVIAISKPIKDMVAKRYKRSSHLIYNGVSIPKLTSDTDYLQLLDIERRKYLLAVARLVPEKGLHNLIDVFEELDTDIKLVIAGGADFDDAYSMSLKARANANEHILMPGYVTGSNLAQLFTHARLFVLPSYHEGLSISLLEALSYGLPTVVSDIPANTEVGLQSGCYFSAGNMQDLRETLEKSMSKPIPHTYSEKTRQWVGRKYNWSDIADKTSAVYKKALS